MPTDERSHDIVLFGATGFAGRLTARCLGRDAPDGVRIALAGRNLDKLASLRDALAEDAPRLADAPLLRADVTDVSSVREVAVATRVVVTTVGPYVLYGDPVVAACAAAGTDYLDLTGEPEFVDTSYVRHHRTALDTGARLIHAAGFDSVPHDLGALFTVGQLPTDAPIAMSGYVRVSAMASGGTLASLLTGLSRPRQNLAAARERRRIETRDATRRARSVRGNPHRDPTQRGWAVPLPTIDPQIVARSARAMPRYGPDFRYSHYASFPRLVTAAGATSGIVALAGLAQFGPARNAVQNRIKAGEGPSDSKRARSWFTVTFDAHAGDRHVVTRVTGRDPGYDETATMLAESALSLVGDTLPELAGQVTTAQAFGTVLVDRLRAAGLGFEVVET